MRDLQQFIDNNAQPLNKNLQKEINKLVKKLGTFSHAPVKVKAMERMERYSQNDDLVDFLATTLEAYYLSKNRFKHPDPQNHFSNFDIVSFWYSFSVLLFSDREKAYQFVDFFITDFINCSHQDFFVLRRMFLLLDKSCNMYSKFNSIVEQHYLSVQQKSDVVNWANAIGMDLPFDREWDFLFRLITEEDSDFNFSLIIKSFNPNGDGICWDIQLQDSKKNIREYWGTNIKEFNFRQVAINGKKQNLTLESKPSLLNLKMLIREIEEIFDVIFNLNIDYSYFSRGIKKKTAVQKWLLS